MGSVGFAMPLLSTLAALVIIVHSAEEDYEREYHMMRPRALDTETNYEQSWRLAEMRPTITQSPQLIPSSLWDETDPEMAMRRRRVRKRKRRPQLPEEDHLVPKERVYTYNEEPQIHPQENIERPRRRRKKMEFQNTNDKESPNGWNEETSRPKKRRGQKRKRPLENSWPDLSEFGVNKEATEGSDETIMDKETQTDNTHDGEYNNQKYINEIANLKVQIYNKDEPEIETTQTFMNDDRHPLMAASNDDRSMSEFSIESSNEKPNKTINDVQKKIKDKGIILPNTIKSPKETESLDPFTLKALLKKSNGKSLSEILQQNDLSLSDLLHGREKALSILKRESLTTQDLGQSRHSKIYHNPISSTQTKIEVNESEREENIDAEIETTTMITTTDYKVNNYNNDFLNYNDEENYSDENVRRNNLRRRFPGGIRRKLRTRPNANDAYKSQLSRDLIALTSMKYRNNRNLSKSREWKSIIPSMIKEESSNSEKLQIETEHEINTTPCSFTETTIQEEYDTTTDAFYTTIDTEITTDARSLPEDATEAKTTYFELEGIDIAQFTTTPLDVNTEQEKETTTYTPKPLSNVKSLNATDMRRQSLNNRLKRKRGRHRTSTTKVPKILEIKDNFDNGKYVTATEFNTKTQTRTTNVPEEDDFMTLEDYLTTEASQHVPSRYQYKKPTNNKNITAFSIHKAFVTEGTAKIEIDEILNDNHTGAKLSKILKERNMTLKELLEHRERGSSHVHLADIFHNASREPNPEPEPFLSKSLIEPISRETYPLRALLDANIHDPRTTTIDPSVSQMNNAHIPVVMDFGNNVNENGENKGIISFFTNYSKTDSAASNSNNKSPIINYDKKDVKINYSTPEIGTARGARILKSEIDSVTWNDVMNIIQKKHQDVITDNDNSLENDPPILDTLKKIDLEEDIDGDGVIVLDDLHQLRNMARKTTPDNTLQSKLNERNKPLQIANESNTLLSDTKSVTVATASIIGLALILFLLTYAILKWKQQNKIFHTKRAKEDEFVPSPVFESRKSLKINSSIRSKSPMLATSNIYSIDTIDTRAGSESPEYMWDTLRKPFQ